MIVNLFDLMMEIVFHFPCLYLKILNNPFNSQVIPVVTQTPFNPIVGIKVKGFAKHTLPLHSTIPFNKQNFASPAPFNTFLEI